MAVMRFITTAGELIELGKGSPGRDGNDGVDGADGLSAYAIWLQTNPGGTLQDFYHSMAPDVSPSALVDTSAGPTYVVDSAHSLVTLTLTAQTEVSFGDFNSASFGLNPEGYSFTLHVIGAEFLLFPPLTTVYGTVGAATEVWVTVIREGGEWKVLIGATA